MRTIRLTTAQALVRYLACQQIERDGERRRFFGGCFGIFGHGNVAGIGEALQEQPDGLRFFPFRNEQAMVHAAVGYARQRNRLGAFACTTSIGPGATNLVTGAALATINRLPVLLLPGDIFARRHVAPVLQQLESPGSQDVSVNDCLRPVSRYWDRINRPAQLTWALPEAMRVLTSPADTGAVTLALPQDVQAEAHDFPAGLFEPRTWHVPRVRPDRAALARAAKAIRASRQPLIVAGGGVIYSEAGAALAELAASTGIPVAESQAGKGTLCDDHPQSLGGVGVTGTAAANAIAEQADLVIGIGTRYSDFTTASMTLLQNPAVRLVNINVAELDAHKQGALSLVGDARATLEELAPLLAGYRVPADHAARVGGLRGDWHEQVARVFSRGHGPPPSQAELIGALARACEPTDVVVNAAGSAPGELHRLWPARDPASKQYHVEYGYSCMGYEIPGALGVKLAAPEREVYALIGDGSYLMLSSDLLTALQERIKLTVLLVDNGGYASIGALSRALGGGGYGTALRHRAADGGPDGEPLRVDLAQNARSLGAKVIEAATLDDFTRALGEARAAAETTVIVARADRMAGVSAGGAWWEVPVAEVATIPSVTEAADAQQQGRTRQRCLHGEGQR